MIYEALKFLRILLIECSTKLACCTDLNYIYAYDAK